MGAVQGLTEFLPVSSSGHLVLIQNLLGMKSSQLLFDISVHTGTMIAVIIFFAKDIINILNPKHPDIKMIALIITGSVPTAVIGLSLKDAAENFFSSPFLAALMLIITGIILWLTKYAKKNGNQEISTKRAIMIGIVQGLAVIPGISRSGSTITAGIFSGIEKNSAAKFSFLLSIPAVAGAQLLSIKDFPTSSDLSVNVILIGVFISFITGYAALSFLMKVIKKGNLYYFAPYCWIIGIAAIFISRIF